MNTKEKLMTLLDKNPGKPLSGSEMAQELGVSRTAVWKAIRGLQEEGYLIDADPGKGYTLRQENDMVTEAGIAKYLTKEQGLRFQVFKKVDSTQNIVRERSAQGEAEGFVAVAMEQTVGRGRRGHTFYSPEGTGIYFSFLLRPEALTEDVGRITTMAAVAVAKAIQACGIEEVGIKWVNDVYVQNKKVCGILSEATTSLETLGIHDVVVGIGLNLYTPPEGFPDDIKDRAGSIFGTQKQGDGRNKLVAYTCEAFFDLYRQGDPARIYEEYKKMCFVPGRRVTVLRGQMEREALALDLDEECRLVVRYDDGTEEALFSGEISLRL